MNRAIRKNPDFAAQRLQPWVFIGICAVALLSGLMPLGVAVANLRVAILDSRHDHAWLGDELEQDRLDRPVRWRNFLLGYLDHVDLISDEVMEKDGLQGYDLLILSETPVLSPRQTEVALNFLRRGNGLLLTGRAGIAMTGEADDQPLARELGLTYRELLRPSGEAGGSSWWVIMDEPNFLSAGLPVMQHLAVETGRPITLDSPAGSAAFWLEAGADAGLNYDQAAGNTAIRSGSYGNGRFIWLGFPMDAVGSELESSIALHRWLLNAFAWFQREAVIEIAPWPHPYNATAVFSMDTETAFGNIRYVAELEKLSVMTYFLLTEPADLYVDLLQQLAGNGPEAAEMAIHGDSHEVFRGQSRARQTDRLRTARRFVEERVGVRPIGFRPPEEAYDYATLQSLVDAGYKYIFADGNPIRNTPRIIQVDNQRLVQYPLLNLDDIKVIIMHDMPPPDQVLDIYLDDMRQMLRRGGLYLSNLHTHVLASPEYIGVLRDKVEYVSAQDIWITNFRELTNWWLQRDRIHLQVISSSPDELLFQVENRGTGLVENLALSLWLPDSAFDPRLEIMPGRRRVLDYRQEAGQLRFSVPALIPDDHQEYRLTWQK